MRMWWLGMAVAAVLTWIGMNELLPFK
ncbi:hypothetical protein IBTHAUMO2_1130069 [Nitrosopumilaceae archaeon]|nr:hypothetical protein IBTHAUMO2_1130069 [Nitrosopumilaceae archaeon]